MTQPTAQGLGQYNLPAGHGVGGRETFLRGRADQGTWRVLLGITWVLADVVLSALLVTHLFYVLVFSCQGVCVTVLFSSGQSHQSSCWRLNVLAACGKYPPSCILCLS